VQPFLQGVFDLSQIIFQANFNFINTMNDLIYPQPPSHKTFDFGTVVIDSNFDSGNLFNA